jgi:hypothetical protein
MQRAQLCAVLGFVMLSAVSAEAREVVFSMENRIGGDSNVFRRSQSRTEDGFVSFVPKVALRERHEELNYDFWYTPIYEAFFDTSGIDGWDHVARGTLDWNVTPRDTIGTRGRFSHARQVRQETTDTIDDALPVVEESDRERIRRSEVSVYYSHQFTPLLRGQVELDFSDIDYNSDRNVDTRAYGGTLESSYAVSPTTSVGISGSGRYRENLGVGLQSSSNSTIGNVALSVSSNLTETLYVSLQAGPSVIRTEEDDRTGTTVPEYQFGTSGGFLVAQAIDTQGLGGSCFFGMDDLRAACPFLAFDPISVPANPFQSVALPPPANSRGKSNTDVTYFAAARLTKTWQRSNFFLSYTRSESASAGVATSSVIDAAIARYEIEPALGWKFSIRGEWSQRKTVSDVEQSVVTVDSSGVPIVTPAGVTPPPGGPFFFAQAVGLSTVVTTNGGNQDVTQWRASATGDRRLTRQLSVLARVYFLRTRSKSVGRRVERDTVYGYVGFRYEFDPVRF